MAKIPKKCPSCGGDLIVSRLSCPQCQTEVSGQFEPDFFARLSPNDFDFVVLFIKSKGNIKEMERELGISYWTIRSKLNEIVEQLGFEELKGSVWQGAPETPAGLAARRQKILEDLNAGLLSVEEAEARLEELKKGPR